MLRFLVVGAALWAFIGEGPWDFGSNATEPDSSDSTAETNIPLHLKLAKELRDQIPATGEILHGARLVEDRAVEEFDGLKTSATETWDRMELQRRKTSVPGADPAPLPLVPRAPSPLVPRVTRVPTDPLPY